MSGSLSSSFECWKTSFFLNIKKFGMGINIPINRSSLNSINSPAKHEKKDYSNFTSYLSISNHHILHTSLPICLFIYKNLWENKTFMIRLDPVGGVGG